MTRIPTTTERVSELLDELRGGCLESREQLLAVAHNRLLAICRRLKASSPEVNQWERTEDVLHDATEGLFADLARTDIKDAPHFYRLAAIAIRRHIQHVADRSARGDAPSARSREAGDRPAPPTPHSPSIEDTFDPSRATRWAQISDAIERLPPEERDVTEMLWFYEMAFDEAANLLCIDEKTLRRRWRRARMELHQTLESAARD